MTERFNPAQFNIATQTRLAERPRLLNRRDFMKLMGATAGALFLAEQAQPLQAAERKYATIKEINALLSHDDIIVGPHNFSQAARNNAAFQLSSDALWSWPTHPIGVHAFAEYDPDKVTPPWNDASIVQSIYGPANMWLHSGQLNKVDLPAEGPRKFIEGEHLTDFVGPVQTKYQIEKARQQKPHLQMTMEGKTADFTLSNILVSPYTFITKDVVAETLQNGGPGKLSIDTCGTTSSFGVEGFQGACQRLGLDQAADVQKALQTLKTPDANGHDIHADITKVLYPAVAAHDKEFADFLLAMYSREIYTASGFRTLSLAELNEWKLPGSNKKGIPFFTGKELVFSYKLL